MLISGKKKYVQSPFVSADELREMVVENTDYFFGPSSFCLSKELISTRDGFGEVPDGFAIDIESRRWFVLNANFAKNDVWSQIAPKVVKQLIAAERSTTKQLLIELIIQQVRDDENMMEKLTAAGIFKKGDKGVFDKDVRGVLGEIFGKSPILGMAIDEISDDLRDWAMTLRVDVKLWVVKKYADMGNSKNTLYEIPPRPELDTTKEPDSSGSETAQKEPDKKGEAQDYGGSLGIL